MATLRSLPSVDYLLQTSEAESWIYRYGRSLTRDAIRAALDEVRKEYARASDIPDENALLEHASILLERWTHPTLEAVINATGVILHTNLGRAPLSRAALKAMHEVSEGYSTLEFDLEKGKRGSRLVHADDLIRRLTGAEAALVVNNNASAVLLVLVALARRKRVVIARTQLVEIGGGFRVPDVMKQSGATLVEIGATNRVHLSDYEQAIEEQRVAMVMRAHRSNFRIIGFTSEPSLAEMAQVAHRAGLPLVDDLGSGALLDTAPFGLGHEPMVQESLEAGADLVCFSGDKLLGGPQAGIIAGRADLVARLKKHPLARALRADKLCLAALSATLLHYLKDEALIEIPIWRMISAPVDEIRMRAEAWANALGKGEIIPGLSTAGGGSLPGETMPTFLLAIATPSPDRILARLRATRPAIIARLEDDRLVFDPRTVFPEQDKTFLSNLHSIWGETYEKRT
ncbi:MAG: L-seryl-tRNA(Sec) selenium transferase [Chloroflexota bacterium]|nr:MAG: L-seryl-tRNA(Sec) selenium transferase [Chloroflexota bacterium]